MMIEQKKELEAIYRLCELVSGIDNIKKMLGMPDEIGFDLMLKTDLLSFLAYVAASDGVIAWKESKYIGELFDIHMTPEKLNKMIIDKNIYSREFEQRVPAMLRIFVMVDNAIYDNPEAASFKGEFGFELLRLYVILAKGLIESNDRTMDDLEENEVKNLSLYIDMLQNYIDDNTKSHHRDLIIDYEKK